MVDVTVLRTLPGVGISFATKITGAMYLYLSSYTFTIIKTSGRAAQYL
jgi:hypothetical protein